MKRAFLVFTNVSTRTGQGLNWDLCPEEKDRLHKVVALLRAEFGPLGATLVLAEYPNFAMAPAQFLAHVLSYGEQGSFTQSDAFVGNHGFLEKLRATETKTGVETLVVSCLSFSPDEAPGRELFFQYFSEWWNKSCAAFGMPEIPQHKSEGDEAVLVVDYEKRSVHWIENAGGSKKESEAPEPASAT